MPSIVDRKLRYFRRNMCAYLGRRISRADNPTNECWGCVAFWATAQCDLCASGTTANFS